jgi:hypothetical protein
VKLDENKSPTKEVVAVKIIKNLPAYNSQGLIEVSILEKVCLH